MDKDEKGREGPQKKKYEPGQESGDKTFSFSVNLNVYQVQHRIANRMENILGEEWERVRDQSESLSVLCQLPSVCQSTSQEL